MNKTVWKTEFEFMDTIRAKPYHAAKKDGEHMQSFFSSDGSKNLKSSFLISHEKKYTKYHFISELSMDLQFILM